MTWKGDGRRDVELDDQQKAIAAEAARQALEIIYAEVGRSTVRFVLKLLGAGCVALLAWLGMRGKL